VATFEVFIHQLSIHFDRFADSRRIQKLRLVARMHIARGGILGLEQASMLRHDQNRVRHRTAKWRLLKVPGVGILDAFGIVLRHLGSEDVLVGVFLPDGHVLEHHRLLVIHTGCSCC
jgi:hypothetical protein